MKGRALCALLLGFAVWCLAPADAQERPLPAGSPAVMLRVDGSPEDPRLDELMTRLRAELGAADFQVVEPTAVGGFEFAFASLCVLESEGLAIDVQIGGEQGGQRLELGTCAEPAVSASDAAVLLAEFLRAHLVARELGTRANVVLLGAVASPSLAPAEMVLRPDPVESPRGVRVVVAVGAVAWVSDARWSMGPALRAGVETSWGLGAGLGLVAPIFGDKVEAPQGSAALRELLLMADVGYAHEFESLGLTLRPAVGVGGLQMQVAGESAPPNVSHTQTVWSPAFSLGLSAEVALASWLAVGAQVSGVMAAQPVEVRILGQGGGVLGGATVVSGVGLSLGW